MDKTKFDIFKKLCDAGSRIAAMKPWNTLGDADLFCLELHELPHPVYFSILGKNGGRKGVIVYASPAGAYGLAKIVGGYPIPKEQIPRYQDSLAMFLRGNDELSHQDISLLKQLDVDCESQDCVYFRRYEYRYCPSLPTSEEAERLTQMLEHLEFMLNSYLSGGIKVDFSSNMLRLSRDKKTGAPVLAAAAGKISLGGSRTLHITNDALMKKLLSRPKIEAKLELDLVFLKSVINDVKYKKPFYARALLMTNIDQKSVLLNEPISPEEDEYGSLITALVRYAEQVGIPQVIFVRDGYIKRALSDTCERLGIMLIVSPKLALTDSIVTEMNKTLNSGGNSAV